MSTVYLKCAGCGEMIEADSEDGIRLDLLASHVWCDCKERGPRPVKYTCDEADIPPIPWDDAEAERRKQDSALLRHLFDKCQQDPPPKEEKQYEWQLVICPAAPPGAPTGDAGP